MASARDSHATAVLDGRLYAVGGSGGSDNDEASLSSVERYDPATNAWEAVAPMATAREGHAMAVLDGKLYAVGGYSFFNDGHLSSVERYDPALDAWEAMVPMVTARRVAVLDGKVYAVGGCRQLEVRPPDAAPLAAEIRSASRGTLHTRPPALAARRRGRLAGRGREKKSALQGSSHDDYL